MVDVRPLLFANALAFMMLLTAGFAKVTSDHLDSGKTIPSVATTPISTFQPSQSTTDDDQNPEQSAQDEKVSDAELDAVFADTPFETEKSSSGIDTSNLDAEALEEESIFADVPKHKGTESAPEAITAAETRASGSEAEHSGSEAMPSGSEAMPSGSQSMSVATETPSATTVPSTEVQASTTAAPEPEMEEIITRVEAPAPRRAAKPKPAAITGLLTVRSNVNEDTVLIDGKPYGPTRLDLELKPGRYEIEVAKSGYTSWRGEVNVLPGKRNTLIARLEEYTYVEYRNGEWVGGVLTGEGSYSGEDGTEYTGSFINKLFHGSGTIRYPDGTKYSGDWFEGQMQGEGAITLANGDAYIGEFKDNQFNGNGTLTKVNGDIYSGFWINGSLSGEGTLTTKQGLLYVGGFSENLFHGTGNLTYPDGTHFEGSFSNGKYHGKGTETFSSGKQYIGQFMDGQYHGQGELLNPNGSKITGTFKFGKPFGKATLTTPEGEIFTARTNEPGVCYRDKSYRATQCPPMEGW
ncbi:hypothetical protein OLMES_2197 [Oleiphilus messinensis]|uniref:PEGA domain-containing protein n=1 Tax=Oleiphilus messinensis TaxID=141451 RepID=A0A1Y0IA16_9GAMM|nr:PEGA domain-containing protein [Oleiphilus messinensis]ARU56264.1 hypothetical protein OLMES_2197 [Oleiphilus messinensis]